MDYLASSLVEAAKWSWLVDKLSQLAKKKALLNVKIDRKTLVASDTINILVNHYSQAIPGKTYICYGVSGCGKTVAATHLLHGAEIDPSCPKRAIMVNASVSEDFPTDFCLQQNAPNTAPLLVNTLCASLVFQEKKIESRAAATRIWEMFSRLCCLAEGCVAPAADEPSIHLYDTTLASECRARNETSCFCFPKAKGSFFTKMSHPESPHRVFAQAQEEWRFKLLKNPSAGLHM